MKIRMKESCMGSDRNKYGHAMPLKNYEAGKEYNVGEKLAQNFCDQQGIAERVETKALPAAPENKAAKPKEKAKSKSKKKASKKKTSKKKDD